MEFRTRDRNALFELYLGAINLPPQNTFEEFQLLCFEGIPDQYRVKSWKLLLKLLPFEERTNWSKIANEQLNSFYSFFDQFIRDPTPDELTILKELSNGVYASKPLLSDLDLLEQIDRDVRRTYPHLNFFQQQVHPCPECPLYTILKHKRRSLSTWLKYTKSEPEFGSRRRSYTNPSVPITQDYHWEAMVRILYLYCKVNPGIGYVQGMNNILAPIYYVCATDSALKNHAEAETFFLFTAIMSELRDLFTKTMDEIAFDYSLSKSASEEGSTASSMSQIPVPLPDEARTNGVGSTMEKLMLLLEKTDPELCENMKQKRLEPLYFAFRWISVMFTQEFSLPDVLRIWDSALTEVYGEPCLSHMQTFLSKLMNAEGNSSLLDFLVQLSCAMVICAKEQIMAGEFEENMQLLQNYSVDIQVVWQQLKEMRHRPKRRSINPTELFDRIRRSTTKYKWTNPFDVVDLNDTASPRSLSSLDLNKSIEFGSTRLEQIKKSSFVLGSQDEVIELN